MQRTHPPQRFVRWPHRMGWVHVDRCERGFPAPLAQRSQAVFGGGPCLLIHGERGMPLGVSRSPTGPRVRPRPRQDRFDGFFFGARRLACALRQGDGLGVQHSSIVRVRRRRCRKGRSRGIGSVPRQSTNPFVTSFLKVIRRRGSSAYGRKNFLPRKALSGVGHGFVTFRGPRVVRWRLNIVSRKTAQVPRAGDTPARGSIAGRFPGRLSPTHVPVIAICRRISARGQAT